MDIQIYKYANIWKSLNKILVVTFQYLNGDVVRQTLLGTESMVSALSDARVGNIPATASESTQGSQSP